MILHKMCLYFLDSAQRCVIYPHTNALLLSIPNMASLYCSVLEAVPTGLGIFLLFVFIFCKFIIHNKKSRRDLLGLPPGPRPWPLVGNLNLLMGDLPHHSLTDLSKKYGHIMFLRLGSVPAVVVSSPAMAKEFLKTHDLLFANRPTVSTGKLITYDRKDVVYANYGEYWRKMKKLCTIELLTVKRTQSFKSVREEEVSKMVRCIWLESGEGVRCVELRNSVSSLTLNIISKMLASRTFSDGELSGGHGFKEMISEMFSLSVEFCIGDFIPYLDWFDFQGLRRRMQAIHKVYDRFAEKVIDDHINCRRKKGKGEEKHGVKDMVDALLDIAETENQTMELTITRVHIKAIILDMLAAGVETASTTIEWAMSELMRNPHVMATAQQEIESEVGRHRFLMESDVASCEYLRCVVKETFRLHPPLPFLIPHKSTGACTVEGFNIPSQTMLFVNIWAMGRDESVWGDPLQFKPERFVGKNIDAKGHYFELLPFGTGRRGCPGISMGLSVVELALAELIHCFDWNVEGQMNMDEVFGLTVPRKFPLSARPSWRLTTHDDSISGINKLG